MTQDGRKLSTGNAAIGSVDLASNAPIPYDPQPLSNSCDLVLPCHRHVLRPIFCWRSLHFPAGCRGSLWHCAQCRSRTGSTSPLERHQPLRRRTLRLRRHPPEKTTEGIKASIAAAQPSDPLDAETEAHFREAIGTLQPAITGLRSLERDSDSAQFRNAGTHGQDGPRAVPGEVARTHVESPAASKSAPEPPRTTEPPPATPEKTTVADPPKEPRQLRLPCPAPLGSNRSRVNRPPAAPVTHLAERVAACGGGGGEGKAILRGSSCCPAGGTTSGRGIEGR